MLGHVTDNGSLNDAASLKAGSVDGQVLSLYGTDSWDITDRLRLDGGFRHEWYSYSWYGLPTAAYNLGDPTTLAGNATAASPGRPARSS